MKKKYKLRKQFQEVLTGLGVPDQMVIDVGVNKFTGEKYPVAVNPQRRVLKSVMKMDQQGQADMLATFKAQLEHKNAQRAKDNEALENG